MGQKISTKEFKEFWDPRKKGVQLIEMGVVLISKSSTKLAGIEVVASRNLDTDNKMYAGNIHCEPDQYSCQTRKSIGMHKYRSVLDSFYNLQATTQSVCIMEAPPTPVNVLMANSEAGRKLEDPKGWLEEGYMTNNHRLSSGRNTIGDYYVQTQKKNIGKRHIQKKCCTA